MVAAGNPTNNVSARRRGDPPPAAACTRPRPHLLHPLRRRGRSVSPVPPASSSRAVLPRPARQVGHPVLRRVRGDRAAPRRGVARRVRLLLVGGLQERQAASSVPPPRRGRPPAGAGGSARRRFRVAARRSMPARRTRQMHGQMARRCQNCSATATHARARTQNSPRCPGTVASCALSLTAPCSRLLLCLL